MNSEALRRGSAALLCLLAAGCYDGDSDSLREAVVIGDEEVTALAVTAPATLVEVGTSLQLVATATVEGGGTVDLSSRVTWESSNPAAASVGRGGRVTGNGNGTATISARLGPFSDSIDITASDAQLLSIAVAGPDTVDECRSATYSAQGTYEDASVRDITTLVAWSSSNTALARFSTLAGERNRLLARDTGGIAVSATRGAVVSPGYAVTVADTLTGISLSPASPAALKPGDTLDFTATGSWGAESADVSRAAAWSVLNDVDGAAIATVLSGDSTPGRVTARNGGTGDVQAVCGGLTASAPLEVLTLTLEITNERPIEIAPGASVLLSLEGRYSDGSEVPLNEQATWSVERIEGTAVTVSTTAGSRGRVTAGADEGLSEVTAEFGGQSVTVSVYVLR